MKVYVDVQILCDVSIVKNGFFNSPDSWLVIPIGINIEPV